MKKVSILFLVFFNFNPFLVVSTDFRHLYRTQMQK